MADLNSTESLPSCKNPSKPSILVIVFVQGRWMTCWKITTTTGGRCNLTHMQSIATQIRHIPGRLQSPHGRRPASNPHPPGAKAGSLPGSLRRKCCLIRPAPGASPCRRIVCCALFCSVADSAPEISRGRGRGKQARPDLSFYPLERLPSNADI